MRPARAHPHPDRRKQAHGAPLVGRPPAAWLLLLLLHYCDCPVPITCCEPCRGVPQQSMPASTMTPSPAASPRSSALWTPAAPGAYRHGPVGLRLWRRLAPTVMRHIGLPGWPLSQPSEREQRPATRLAPRTGRMPPLLAAVQAAAYLRGEGAHVSTWD